MLRPRLIPCLLLHKGGLVKTVRHRSSIYIGDPVNAVRIFNEKGADEIIVLDIDASKQQRGPNLDVIQRIAEECFMPLTYGGGISSIEQAAQVLRLGVEKISIQNAALNHPGFIRELADNFGSQSVVVSVDVMNRRRGPLLWNAAAQKCLRKPWLEYLSTLGVFGAGEILLSDVDREGTRQGLNLDIVQKATSNSELPIVFMGGANSIEDVTNALRAGASAVSVGSMVTLYGPHRAVLITYPPEQVITDMRR
jgi:cyclase